MTPEPKITPGMPDSVLPNPLRPAFITQEMIERNPVLGAAGSFAGDPLWLEVIEEIKRNRELDREDERREEK